MEMLLSNTSEGWGVTTGQLFVGGETKPISTAKKSDVHQVKKINLKSRRGLENSKASTKRLELSWHKASQIGELVVTFSYTTEVSKLGAIKLNAFEATGSISAREYWDGLGNIILPRAKKISERDLTFTPGMSAKDILDAMKAWKR